MKKNKGGRPTLYHPEYCDLVIQFMKEGRSKKAVAAILEVHIDTIYEWEKVHPEFSDALKKAVGFSEAWWEEEGRTNLKNKEFNATLWYMNMKNRFKWSDKVETHSTHVIKQEDALKELE